MTPLPSLLQMVTDPITLVIALDKAGTARGELYLDDGRSYAFQVGACILACVPCVRASVRACIGGARRQAGNMTHRSASRESLLSQAVPTARLHIFAAAAAAAAAAALFPPSMVSLIRCV